MVLHGAILTGGKNSRMGGFPKGKLRLNGERLFDNVFNVIQPIVSDIHVSVHDEPPLNPPESTSVIRDHFTGIRSSMNGVYSVLRDLGDPVVIIPWDMPSVTVEQLERLRGEHRKLTSSSGIFYELEGVIQPFPGLYRPSLLPHLESALENNRYSLRRVLKRTDVKIIDATENAPTPLGPENFSSVNSPEDVRQLSTQ